ncbi:glycosyl transferase family 2 [Nostoc sp. T09]|uniref:glycosyltransferase family 2 protein n=1 Tax=Nostoc sp. T09 TaxID=1932621 RepID=UPI000A3AFAC6|nr:glycosyltransferase family 2 protein [Nostoc sp. T09]OUL36831.1 glycosyl transferase family 2 [Nostoc sp. T09]
MQELQTQNLQPIKLSQLPESPLVSVLVPNYNYAKYVGETLDSAIRQTYSHYEVIVCDDGSTDQSCEIIEAYLQKDSRIKLIRKPNGGVGSALNTAYQESKGQIICILDADDVWMDNKLYKIVEAFKAEPSSGFAIHNVIPVDANGNVIERKPLLSSMASGWMAISALENGGFIDDLPPASALCFRREVTDCIFPLNEAFVRNADALVRNFALFLSSIVPVKDVLSKYRLHGSNLTFVQSLSADYLEREMNVAEQINLEIKHFLSEFYGPDIATRLTSIKSRQIYCHNRYIVARLKKASKSERREAHQQLINHPQFSWSGVEGWLLKKGEYLPDSVFALCFNQIYGNGWLKRLVKFIRKQRAVGQNSSA